MQIIDIIIYILAIIGIFFTMFTIIENYSYKMDNLNYNLKLDSVNKNKKVELIIKLRGINKKEEETIVKKIEKGDYEDIKKIVDNVKVKKWI